MNKRVFEVFIDNIVQDKLNDYEKFHMAFTHPSYNHKSNYERLELLGDAVLNLAITHILLDRYPAQSEGFITQLRISYVNGKVLSRLSKALNFHRWIKLGKGEEKDSGYSKESILANVFEAFIGALYLEKGLEFVINWLINNFELFEETKEIFQDYKSLLQEYLQERKLQLPVYEVEKEEGKSHNKTFYVKLVLFDKSILKGIGKTKKSAEQDAAKKAIELLKLKI